jgi:hypothetical protein
MHRPEVGIRMMLRGRPGRSIAAARAGAPSRRGDPGLHVHRRSCRSRDPGGETNFLETIQDGAIQELIHAVAVRPESCTSYDGQQAPRKHQRRKPMASESPEHSALDVWPRAVMATLLLLITLITLHLVQLSWFGDATATRPAPAADLAQHR